MRHAWIIFRERPLRAVIFLTIVAWLAISVVRLAHPGGDGDPGPAVADSARAAEIKRVRYSDPDRALTLIREVQADPVSREEREDARSMLGDVLDNRFYANKEAGRFAAAEADMQILAREAPDAYQLTAMRQEWGDHLKRRWHRAVEAGAEAEADVLVQQILTDYVAADPDFLAAYQKDLIARWKRASVAGDTDNAERWLLEGARILVSVSANSGISRELRAGRFRGEELYVYARRMDRAGKHAEAIPFYQAALRKLDLAGSQETWSEGRLEFTTQKSLRRKLEERLVDVFVRVGDGVLQGEAAVITTCSAVEIYEGAIQSTQDQALRLKPCMRKLEYQIANFYGHVEPVEAFDIEKLTDLGYLSQRDISDLVSAAREAQKRADVIMHRTAVEAWRAQLADQAFDPWPLLDKELAEIADKALPGNATEADRRRQLVFAARKKVYLVPYPQLREVQEHLWRVYARWGIFHLRTDRMQGFRILRPVLRGTTNMALRRTLARTLRNLILKKDHQKDYAALCELAIFYDAEIGIDARQAAFRKAIRSSLGRAIAHFEALSQPMKATMALALLGDIIPGEPLGRAARNRTIMNGFEIAADLQSFREAGDYNPDSGLDGLSVVVVDNDTEQTLLCLYRGTETFYVRCRPFRRGCIVLRNGEYELAVLTASDKIFPYRARIAFSSEVKKSVYRIDDDPRGDDLGVLGTRAEYTFLRVPDDVGDLTVDPRTGSVRQRH